MRRFLDFLARFRPTSTPGAAATGVPADRAAELTDELGPSLAALAAVQEEAARIRAEASRKGERVRHEAVLRAAEIVAEAQARVAQVGEEAATPARRAAQAEAAAIRRDGERAAESVRRRAQERMPALVDRVVRDAWRGMDDPRIDSWAPGGSRE